MGKEYIDGLKSYVYMFNADLPEFKWYYGPPCKIAYFKSLLDADKENEIKSWVLIGDLLLYNYCEKIVNVKISKNSSSHSLRVDKDMYASLAWDLIKSIKESWNTVNIELFSKLLFAHNIFCITAYSVPVKIREQIDSSLQKFAGYIGSFEIDVGNPLHNILFFNYLIKEYFISGKAFYFKTYFDESPYPDWANRVPFSEIQGIDEFEMIERFGAILLGEELSERGKETNKIIEYKRTLTHREKLANEINMKHLNNIPGEGFSFYTETGKAIKEAIVPLEKLVCYSLNPEHPDGKGKAKLFKDMLAIEAKDSNYLAAQLIDGLKNGVVKNVRITQYGVQYHIDIPIKGLNDVSKIVRSAWIVKEDSPAQLTTAYIADQKDQNNEIGRRPPIILEQIQGDEYWTKLYDLACNEGISAANKHIPTPMFIKGYTDPVDDGEFGHAYIIIPDARKGFGLWLKKNSIGYKNYPTGWCVFAPDSYYEKGKIYAEAFASVLQLNGVNCSVVARLN